MMYAVEQPQGGDGELAIIANSETGGSSGTYASVCRV
jgi:hypothetical protein